VRINKPILLHLDTFRRYEHCGPNLDDDLGYRSNIEIQSYLDRDPLKILGNKLVNSEVITEKFLEDLIYKIDYYVQEVFTSMKRHNREYLAEFKMST
jgi:pyruvate dehydrogenase E1 component alpha subunit